MTIWADRLTIRLTATCIRLNTTITADGAKERYYFNTDNNLKEYRLEEGGVMSKAEQYVYNPYWKGSTKQRDPKVVTTSTTKESLRGKALTNFVFTAGDTETTTLDQFENPLKTTNSRVKLDAGGTNYLTVETDRLYDDNQKLIEEVTTGTYSKDNKSIVSHIIIIMREISFVRKPI